MLVNGKPVIANVYSNEAKDGHTTYWLNVRIEGIGAWLPGVKVVVFHEGTGECKVYKPSHWNPRKKKFDSDIEFDTEHMFWQIIAATSVAAVEESAEITLKQAEE